MTRIDHDADRFCLVHPHRALTWSGHDWQCPDCALREAFGNNSPIPPELAGSKVDITDALGHKIGEGRLTADGMIDGVIDYSKGEGSPYTQQLTGISMAPEPEVVIGYNFEKKAVVPESEWKLGSPEVYTQKAIKIVTDFVYEYMDKDDFEVYVVWFCKTLQNWKALLSTTIADNRYYEVTYNGDNHEAYLDVYLKIENLTIPD